MSSLRRVDGGFRGRQSGGVLWPNRSQSLLVDLEGTSHSRSRLHFNRHHRAAVFKTIGSKIPMKSALSWAGMRVIPLGATDMVLDLLPRTKPTVPGEWVASD